MSGVLINDYSNSDSNILAVQSTLDKTFFGKIDSITLTEFDSSTVPAIAAGSVVECNGAIYSFASEEAISTTDPVTSATVADGTVYVLLVPSTSTITAAFTATAPTWSDSKQGFYGTGDEVNYRYVARCIKASTSYTEKYMMVGYYQYIENLKSDNSALNDVDISGDITLDEDFQQFQQIEVYTGTLDASGDASFDSGLSNLENYICIHVSYYKPASNLWIVTCSNVAGGFVVNLIDSTAASLPNYIQIGSSITDSYSNNYRIVIAKMFS